MKSQLMSNTFTSRGFTLIETMLVLLVIGLLSTTITLSMTHSYHLAQRDTVVASIKHYDQMLRLDAVNFGKHTTLEIDKENGTFKRVPSKPNTKILSTVGQLESYRLPAGYSISRYWVSPQWQTADKINITASDRGHTQTYAVEIQGPEQKVSILIFAGLSGQTIELEGDLTIDEYLMAIQSSSNY